MGKMKTKTLLIALVMIITAIVATSVAPVAAAPGDIKGNVSFGQQCTSGIGVGITYDGTNLWYSCYNSATDLIKTDPKTGAVSASYTLEDGLGSLAYDATRNVIWAAIGGGNGISGEIYKIQLDASKNVTGGAVPAFNTGVPSDLVDGLGFDATVTPNQLYFSPDGSTTIYVYDVNGNPIRSFAWNGSSCFNSGVAIGGDLLFQGSNGCSHVWVVNKNTLAPSFNFSTRTSGDPNFRDESLTCDPNTFAPADVMWSKEAYFPMRAHAFEIPKGTCGFGGNSATPKGNVSGMKFNDIDGNGKLDVEEPGLANWTITLKNETGSVITTLTDANGNYSFTNLTDGNYTVGEVQQSGWNQTAPATGVYNVTITGGSVIIGKDFGNVQISKKCDAKKHENDKKKVDDDKKKLDHDMKRFNDNKNKINDDKMTITRSKPTTKIHAKTTIKTKIRKTIIKVKTIVRRQIN
jgi:hypothetical protein